MRVGRAYYFDQDRREGVLSHGGRTDGAQAHDRVHRSDRLPSEALQIAEGKHQQGRPRSILPGSRDSTQRVRLSSVVKLACFVAFYPGLT